MIETRQLRYFIAVAEEQHFGRAAARLMMAQPPLSQQIRQLEATLGATLLTRTTRRVELTAAGSLLLERGRRIIDDLDALGADVARVGDGLQGVLRVGFTGSATYGLMPRVVREASHELPGIALSVSGELLTPQLEAALLEHRIDVALLRPPVTSDEIRYLPSVSERIVAALPADSPLTALPHLRMEDFDGQVLVGYPEESTLSRTIAARWVEVGARPRHAQRVSETSTLLSLVAAGIGAALVPSSATSLNLGGTVFRDVEDAPPTGLAVAWRGDDPSPAVLRFIDFLTRLVDAEGARA
jgi:DNA-binding transcriptional LysR family regulator